MFTWQRDRTHPTILKRFVAIQRTCISEISRNCVRKFTVDVIPSSTIVTALSYANRGIEAVVPRINRSISFRFTARCLNSTIVFPTRRVRYRIIECESRVKYVFELFSRSFVPLYIYINCYDSRTYPTIRPNVPFLLFLLP